MDSLNSEGITFKRPKAAALHLRVATKRKKPTGNSSTKEESLDVNILRTFEEPSETISRRLELYENVLSILQHQLQCVERKFNRDLKGKLDNFIQSSFHLIEKVDSVIPLGILESGLSIGENCAIFDYVEQKLKNLTGGAHGKVFVSRVQSGTSSSTKAVFQKIFGQLITEESKENAEEESEGSSPTAKTGVSKRVRHYSLYDVKSFLSSLKQKYKIVIIVEDIDYFANAIITQLLTLIGCAKLPIVFIFGATHGHFIDNLIPLNNSSEFVLEKFYSVSPRDRLDDFMRRILFDPLCSFRISGPIVAYLESQYKENNSSVEQIFNSIKFCLRHHFLTGKATFCSLENSSAYSESELQLFKDVCLGSNCTNETPRKRRKVKSQNVAEELDSSIDNIKTWQFLLRLLNFMNKALPERPLGDSFACIYASCYDGHTMANEADENNPLHRFFKTLGSISKADLQYFLEESITFLKGNQTDNLAPDLVIEFEDTLAKMLEVRRETKENSDDSKTERKLRKPKGLQELKESLMEMKRQQAGTSAVHEARMNLVESLKKLLKKYLKPFDALRCSNVFAFTDLNQVINIMYPANFLQLNEDIMSPGYVLQCECCSDLDDSSLDSNLPDVCIIHKLLSEHTTKKVDLNLIYHAFISVIQPTATGRKSKITMDTTTASYLVRFRRAVGELQHMGFIKRSKSKSDEISRLTWW